jgi:hypothetical protein
MVDKTPGSKPLWTPPRLDLFAGLTLALVALVLYLFTLAPTVLEADSGEFQFVPWLPGIPHPTGYPLYTLLGWLWTHLFPLGEVAWRMNALSAVFAAFTVGLTFAVARQLLDQTLPDTPLPARMIAAAIAAATFAVTHTFWSQAIVAEVYTLHAMFIALLLWLALKLGHMGHTDCNLYAWPAKLLTFTFGLSLTHHSTTILLLPALAFFGWSIHQNIDSTPLPGSERSTGRLRLWATHGILFVTPLLLYLYLPLIAATTPYARLTLSDSQVLTLYDNSWRGFWHYITVFAGEVQPAAVGLERLLLTWQLLWLQVGWIGTVFALIGLVTLWQRRQFALLLLTGVGSLTFLLFNLIYFIGDIFVLFIPVWLFVCLWIGCGSLGLGHWIANRFVQSKVGPRETRPIFGEIEQHLAGRIYRLLVVSLMVACFVICVAPIAASNYVAVNQKNNTAARERWLAILTEPVPEGAVLLSNDRNEIMPMWYYQYVEGRRPDLMGLFPLIVTDPAYANVGRVLDQALASGRPVYLIKPMAGLGLKADLTQVGTLYQATANSALPPQPYEIVLPGTALSPGPDQGRIERIKLLGYDLSPEKVLPGAQVMVTLHWQAIQQLSTNYTSYVHLINSEGQGITQSDHQPGGDFYPSSYWQIGEILRDRHILTLPADTPPGVYRLRVGMYHQPEPGYIEGMGPGVEIGSLTVASE